MISPTLGPSLSVARRGPHIGDCNESYADRHVEILYDRTWSMAAVHFEDWITRKRSLRPSLWESAYVGYQAVTSVTARTALGRLRVHSLPGRAPGIGHTAENQQGQICGLCEPLRQARAVCGGTALSGGSGRLRQRLLRASSSADRA